MSFSRPVCRFLTVSLKAAFLGWGVAAFVALVLLPATSAYAAETPLRGAQLHSLWWDGSTEDMDRELDLLKDAGANAVRIDIAWSSLETNGKGRYSQWYVEKADTFIDHARARDIKVIATLWSTPCWASSAPADKKQNCEGEWWDRGVDRYAPANNSDYADTAVWAAKRWGTKIEALEIWNEPNLPDKYSLQAPDPALAYAGILKTAYPRVKAEMPDLTVLGGALAFSDVEFLERLYALGIKGNFDALSIHPYNEWRDPDDAWKPEWKKYTYLTGVPAVHLAMTAHGDGDKGLWLTEFGFSTCGEGSSWCVSEAKQAEYIKDSFRIAGDWSFVKAAIAYNLRNKGSDPTDREDQFGMVRRDFSPKPAYRAFKEALGGDLGTATPQKNAADGEQGPATEGTEPALELAPLELSLSGVATVRISCPEGDAGCAGSVRIETPRPVAKKKSKAKSKSKRRSTKRTRRARKLTIGARTFRVRPGTTTVVRVRLRARSSRLLAARKRIRISSTAVARHNGSSRTARRSFVLGHSRLARLAAAA